MITLLTSLFYFMFFIFYFSGYLSTGREVYLSKLFLQGKLGAANSMEKICVNYTSDSETPDGDLPCTVS